LLNIISEQNKQNFLNIVWSNLTSSVLAAEDQLFVLVPRLQVDQPGLLPAHELAEEAAVNFPIWKQKISFYTLFSINQELDC
jgi:hypothetical protein